MYPKQLLPLTLAAASLPAAYAEEVLGVYIFHRHGDRTAKSWKPVNLTALGADEVFSSANFYRNRYVEPSSSMKIPKISSNEVKLSQLSVTAPEDAVLYNSALTFTQGLYPPTGQSVTLRNGTKVEAPLGGYQYIPVGSVSEAAGGDNSESSEWLQGQSGCDNAEASSNNYLNTAEYKKSYQDSLNFYQSLLPVINTTFDQSEANFKNSYTIFDYINVAEIHNATIPSSDLITNESFAQLYQLASTHEWNLAFNASDPARSISGAVLAGQVLGSLNAIVNGTSGVPTFNIQFGAYGTFSSVFGLTNVTAVSDKYFNIVDYASSMVWELVTNKTSNPTADDISVRFYFANGTAAQNELQPLPLFNQQDTVMSWNDFQSNMDKIAVRGNQQWCNVCGNKDGICANLASTSGSSSSSSSSTSSSNSGNNGISKAVAGVIGAMVTLAVILGLEGLLMVAGGLRLVKKSTLMGAAASSNSNVAKA